MSLHGRFSHYSICMYKKGKFVYDVVLTVFCLHLYLCCCELYTLAKLHKCGCKSALDCPLKCDYICPNFLNLFFKDKCKISVEDYS